METTVRFVPRQLGEGFWHSTRADSSVEPRLFIVEVLAAEPLDQLSSAAETSALNVEALTTVDVLDQVVGVWHPPSAVQHPEILVFVGTAVRLDNPCAVECAV